LQLRHVFLGRRFFRECPGQHELGLEHRAGRFDPAVEGGRHPAQSRVSDLALDISEDMTGIALVPSSVQVLGRNTKLDNQVAGQVFRLNLAPLLPPQPKEGGFIITHDYSGVGAPNEIAPIGRPALCGCF
jgi:hypothetical protein